MRSTAGFTLLEILVVVLIITVLATIVGVNVAGRPGEARRAAAEVQIRAFETALRLYRMDHGFYPTQRQGIEALVAPAQEPPRPSTFPEGGYLDAPVVPRDPWGNRFVYLVPGPPGYAFQIVSYGSDGEPGGQGEAADISNVTLD